MKTIFKMLFAITIGLCVVNCSDNSSSSSSGGTINPQYAYITDGNELKIVDVATASSPSFVGSIALNSSYFVSVSPDVAYVAQYDAVEPYLSVINVSNPSNPQVFGNMPKSNTNAFSLISDMFTLNGVAYLTDIYRGLHVLDISNPNVLTSQLNMGGDAMSLTKIQNELFVIDQANGLHSYNISTPGLPAVTSISNSTDVDTSSYSDAPIGQYHSWVETDGIYLYVANTIDKKIKQFDAATLTLINEVSIEGFPSAFAIHNGYAYVTTKASINAPLQTSFDGVRMYDLATLSLFDLQPLNRASGVALNGDYAYVTDSDGLHIYDISSNDFSFQSTLATGYGNYIALGE
ncbi:hypothetical protein HNV08_15105 [Winogradskyella eckloniae]|uniref:LVIVD repeat-containing protein n=1 Tax=Winogradskyella eckloniae TaxID=1089306 RepID=UPI0015655D7A|nr:hypothetical protein [Winogradskyella eckloniae]NRD21383.1 hypothetical protein [Winogradskyella eckloniae]